MTSLLYFQKPSEFLCFASFDKDTRKLLYSKYNFDFDKYINDKNLIGFTKNEIFYDFLINNNSYITEPFIVKDELTQYFRPITPEIELYFDEYNYLLYNFNTNQLTSYVTKNTIMEREFQLIEYDYFLEIPTICEFLFIDYLNGEKIFCKYNFYFDMYSLDFNVYGSKICIFSDFLFRFKYLSNLQQKMPDIFFKYFNLDSDSQEKLKTYLQNLAVFSASPVSKKNTSIINFNEYSLKYNLNMSNIDTHKYFLKYGQFQQDDITFLPKSSDIIYDTNKSVCYVYTKNTIGTGFLFSGNSEYKYVNGVKQIYLLTCFHLIKNQNKDVIYATCYYNESTSLKLLFRIIGYDIYTDVCVAVYDPYLDYNKNCY